MINPFIVNTPQQILDDLQLRIKTPVGLTNNWFGVAVGTNLLYMKELTDYWVNTFDWRKIEKENKCIT